MEHVYVNVMNYIWSINLSRTDFKHPLKIMLKQTGYNLVKKCLRKQKLVLKKLEHHLLALGLTCCV